MSKVQYPNTKWLDRLTILSKIEGEIQMTKFQIFKIKMCLLRAIWSVIV